MRRAQLTPAGFACLRARRDSLAVMAPLSDSDIEQRLSAVGDWHREQETIVRDCAFADFAAAIAFVNRVAAIAEAANHHPDILLHGWNKVRLTLSTHSAGGLTDADFRLAGQIDEEL
jgi:4a-hydroxytetrahydrobiopterin dehydratase